MSRKRGPFGSVTPSMSRSDASARAILSFVEPFEEARPVGTKLEALSV
jgi:hypothetical protein